MPLVYPSPDGIKPQSTCLPPDKGIAESDRGIQPVAVPGVLSTRQPIATPNQPTTGSLKVAEGWFEHPKVRLAYRRGDGSALSTLTELREILEETERVCEELGRRGGALALTEVLERVETIAADQRYGADSLTEIRDLLKNGFTQAELNRMFGWADAPVVRTAREGLDIRRPPATDEKIVEIYRSGLSIHDTAKALRTNHVIVSKVVRASGCPLHRPVKKACRSEANASERLTSEASPVSDACRPAALPPAA